MVRAKAGSWFQDEVDCSGSATANFEGEELAPWREKVALWCYDVCDHLGEDRRVVFVAMNLLDRYCTALGHSCIGERWYEMASLTALFLAIRIAGSSHIDLAQLGSLSRTGFSLEELASSGKAMVRVLRWDHRIVTPQEHLLAYSKLFQCASTGKLLEVATYCTELAVCDVSFAMRGSSSIAIACMLAAAEAVLDISEVEMIQAVLCQSDLIADDATTHLLRERATKLYKESYDDHQPTGPAIIEEEDETIECCCREVHRGDVPSLTRSVSIENLHDMASIQDRKRIKLN